eukprot:CAMPEP_0179315720 /NCGR_PEP_ID=MMETSP0797-20121207/55244_1 /TAXON_ID=47934 /ORGANISM="Dinophysis acuminata, Strain DAEP01" /LENGTH=45 /DNA_ID= /DNA_START= /DNA_END= /DNA_ORIENTATION=
MCKHVKWRPAFLAGHCSGPHADSALESPDVLPGGVLASSAAGGPA